MTLKLAILLLLTITPLIKFKEHIIPDLVNSTYSHIPEIFNGLRLTQ